MRNDIWDQLEGIYAYEQGATDSGIRDEVLRSELVAQLDLADDDEVRLSLSRWIRDGMLSEESLAARYGWEDVLGFLRWFGDGEYRGAL